MVCGSRPVIVFIGCSLAPPAPKNIGSGETLQNFCAMEFMHYITHLPYSSKFLWLNIFVILADFVIHHYFVILRCEALYLRVV